MQSPWKHYCVAPVSGFSKFFTPHGGRIGHLLIWTLYLLALQAYTLVSFTGYFSSETQSHEKNVNGLIHSSTHPLPFCLPLASGATTLWQKLTIFSAFF